MADPLITEADLLLAFNGNTEQLRRLAGDDGTGSPNDDRVEYGIAVASEEAYGILLAGFGSNEAVQNLAANDVSVRHAIAMLWRDVLAQGKDEFRLPDGKTMFADDSRKARDMLREKSRGAKRSSAEEVTPNGPGRSSLLRPRATSAVPSVIVDSYGRPVGF